jgi:tyrosyl-tRNA synthetase
MVNNADWLLKLNYVDFLRDIGSHFSVNRMLTADCFKARMEKGLSFLEFNYMLMQSYDFLVLNQKFNCQLQLGGDDQWSNILSGADLIRRKENKPAYAMTFTLLTTSDGKKMGKTAKGAIWLDKEKTSPYEFYQYWRNIDDADVEKCLKLLTFIDLEQITELTKYQDERINKAKEILAFELTKLVHGEDAASEAQAQVKAAFSCDTENMPSIEIDKNTLSYLDAVISCGICKSKGEARRLIEGGGVTVNETKLTTFDAEIENVYREKGEFIIHKGKKVHLKVILK